MVRAGVGCVAWGLACVVFVLSVAVLAPAWARAGSCVRYASRPWPRTRDLRPSNVLMWDDGPPVLADFGQAKMMERSGPALTQSGMIVGMPEYMAPEQCSGEEVGPAADIYSMAVVAYEMLTGRPPFM